MSGKAKDLTGQQFGRLKVLERAENKDRCVMWKCLCTCGETKEIQSRSLVAGLTQSCGCLRKERAIKSTTTHGDSKTRLYRIWRNMKSRCSCESASKYNIYGGKGITVCEQWIDFSGFREWALSSGYKENLTLDRVDGNKGYCPDNCRWASYKDQANNTTQNRIITYKGKSMTMAQWATHQGLSYKALSERIRRNWSVERALITPLKRKGARL